MNDLTQQGRDMLRNDSLPWTSISAALPPLLQLVEARLSLGEQRTIILNVMRANHGDTGPIVWLNATTNSSLPSHWQPIEWRPVAGWPLPAPAEPTPPSRTPRRT
jgi:hypothetical protein